MWKENILSKFKEKGERTRKGFFLLKKAGGKVDKITRTCGQTVDLQDITGCQFKGEAAPQVPAVAPYGLVEQCNNMDLRVAVVVATFR
jgi:hypothetical protein